MTEQGAPSGLLAAPSTDARQGPRKGSRAQRPQGRWKQGEAKAVVFGNRTSLALGASCLLLR